MQRILFGLATVVLLAGAAFAWAEAAPTSWTGEVIDIACYVPKGASGPGHAGCAKSCVKNGQPMGLLAADGTVFLLAADHANGDAYAALKEMAGGKAEVSGSLAEKGGVKVITVTGAKAG